MLETIISLVIILYASALALGVGSSTLAATSFLVAISDGNIETSERRILGGIYTTLRIAMVLILATTLCIVWQVPGFFGDQTPFVFTLIVILYANAVSMTKHWTSVRFNPALQAATWYTLGFITTIHMFSLFNISLSDFLTLYAVDVAIGVLVVNFFLNRSEKKECN